jgi:acetyltransferase-like isoleucine patch superfamily enzyme
MRHALSKVPGVVSQALTSRIDDFVLITAKTTIGHFVHVASHCAITGEEEARLGDFTGVAGGCRLLTSSDVFGDTLAGPCVPQFTRPTRLVGPVTVEPFVFLGANVVVMPGVTVGEGACVTANSIVTQSLEPWKVYGGRPLRVLRDRPGQAERARAYARELWRLHQHWLDTCPEMPWMEFVAALNAKKEQP